MATLNRTGSTRVAPAPTPYAEIEVMHALPMGEADVFRAAFESDIAGPLGLEEYSEEWWKAFHVARRSWYCCLQHGWRIGRREAQQRMAR